MLEMYILVLPGEQAVIMTLRMTSKQGIMHEVCAAVSGVVWRQQ